MTPKLRAPEMVTLEVDQIRPHPLNPNVGAPDLLDSSIDEHDYLLPVLVQKPTGNRKLYRLIDGEQRWRLAKAKGMAQITALPIDCTDEEAVQLLATINPTGRAGVDNADKALELIRQAGGWQQTAYRKTDVDRLLAEAARPAPAPKPEPKPIAAPAPKIERRQLVVVLPAEQHDWAAQALDGWAKELRVSRGEALLLILQDKFVRNDGHAGTS